MNISKPAIRRLLIVAAAAWPLCAAPAQGAMFLTGSVNQATSNLGLQTSESRGGSVSVDVGLGNFVRVGLTHQQRFTESEGFLPQDEDEDGTAESYKSFIRKEHILANSIDFTFILYEGQLLVPYVKAGAIWKSYIWEQQEANAEDNAKISTDKDAIRNAGPFPNLGAGIGIKLNQQFTLKIFHKASPGFSENPITDEKESIWDRETTVGLTYQL